MSKPVFMRNQFLNVVSGSANNTMTTGPKARLLRIILSLRWAWNIDGDYYLVQVGYTTAQLLQALNDQPMLAEFQGYGRQDTVKTATMGNVVDTFEFSPGGIQIPASTVISIYYAAPSGTLTGRVFFVFEP